MLEWYRLNFDMDDLINEVCELIAYCLNIYTDNFSFSTSYVPRLDRGIQSELNNTGFRGQAAESGGDKRVLYRSKIL